MASSSAHQTAPIFFQDLVDDVFVKVASIPPRKAGQKSTGTPRALRIVKAFFDKVKAKSQRPLEEIGPQLFDLILPHLDRKRVYGMKELKLGTLLAKGNVLGFSTAAGQRGERLLRWEDNAFFQKTNREDKSVGCFGACLEGIIAERWEGTSSPSRGLTVQEVDRLLNELAALSQWSHSDVQQHKNRSVESVLEELFSRLPPLSAGFLAQIILKDLTPLLHPLSSLDPAVCLQAYNSVSTYIFNDKMALLRQWSPILPHLYKARATFSSAFQLLYSHTDESKIQMRTCIEIPKAIKGSGYSATEALSPFIHSDTIVAEVKYDGERMQIHITLSPNQKPEITIFSKSKRDSTQDRRITHSTILAAVGVDTPPPHMMYAHPCLRHLNQPSLSRKSAVTNNIILEAEMVPYSESSQLIQPFWKITSCYGDRREDWGKVRKRKREESDLPESQKEVQKEDMHLMLVFFDVLYLDDRELVNEDYATRRGILESVVNEIEGFTKLAELEMIDVKGLGIKGASERLRQLFRASNIRREEGLMLKCVSSRYNGGPPWVKLKKDYIDGEGDTADLVCIGASWSQQRGRELRVAPNVMTTFFIAAKIETPARLGGQITIPRFKALFTASYGLDRRELLSFQNYIESGDSLDPKYRLYGNAASETMGYQVDYATRERPVLLLRTPIAVEMMGAGYQKGDLGVSWQLRWPRVMKWYKPDQRMWIEALTLSQFNERANIALGRVAQPASSSTTPARLSKQATGEAELDWFTRDYYRRISSNAIFYGLEEPERDPDTTDDDTQFTPAPKLLKLNRFYTSPSLHSPDARQTEPIKPSPVEKPVPTSPLVSSVTPLLHFNLRHRDSGIGLSPSPNKLPLHRLLNEVLCSERSLATAVVYRCSPPVPVASTSATILQPSVLIQEPTLPLSPHLPPRTPSPSPSYRLLPLQTARSSPQLTSPKQRRRSTVMQSSPLKQAVSLPVSLETDARLNLKRLFGSSTNVGFLYAYPPSHNPRIEGGTLFKSVHDVMHLSGWGKTPVSSPKAAILLVDVSSFNPSGSSRKSLFKFINHIQAMQQSPRLTAEIKVIDSICLSTSTFRKERLEGLVLYSTSVVLDKASVARFAAAAGY